MIKVILQRVFLLAFLFVPLGASADDDDFSQIVVFGDSLSDNGNLAILPILDPVTFESLIFLNEFPFDAGFSNGPRAVEVLASGLGLQAEPSLFLGGPAVITSGTNYAVAGARAVSDDTADDLPDQISAFLTSPFSYVSSDGLYVIFIGNNDVFAALAPGVDSVGIIRNAVNGITDAISELAWLGAENFLVVNVPDVAATPLFLGVTEATALTELFNHELAEAIDELEDDLDIEIVEFDTFEFLNSVLNNSAELGFENTEESCLELLLMNPLLCDFNKFLFFDDVHPTAKAHALAGEAMLELVRDDDNEDKDKDKDKDKNKDKDKDDDND